MKGILTVVFISFLAFTSYGQDFTISVAPTLNHAFYYQFVAGGASNNSKFGAYTSLEYIKSGVDKLSYGFGLSYQNSNVEIHYPAYLEVEPHSESLNLITASFKTVFNFQKERYLTVDPFIDLQLKSNSQQVIDDQNGLGLSVGYGKRFALNKGTFINLEPRLWVHNILPFTDQNMPLRLTVIGFKAGINFRRDKSSVH